MLVNQLAQGFAVLLLFAAWTAPQARSEATAMTSPGQIGDRLVVVINNVPYTQRQVELYITIKESLRKTTDTRVRVVNAENWSEALSVYAEDTIILQEAQRLGTFAAADQLLDKYSALVREKIARGDALRLTLERLGADDHEVATTLETVLRVAAFRRSKDRQEAQGGGKLAPLGGTAAAPSAADSTKKSVAAAPGATGATRWLSELTFRAVVRQYQDAARYVLIQPTSGGKPSPKVEPNGSGR